ncbi:hypothetical protein JCM11491_002519 [Sporobolomyces phaffii]
MEKPPRITLVNAAAINLAVRQGFATFYRRFIKNYSSIASPFTRLDRKDILRHFDPSLPLELETDASDVALDAVLSQQHDERVHLIASLSRKFLPPELNYELHDKELLAIVDACKAWRAYLSHSQAPTKIFSDHFNLKYLSSSETLIGCKTDALSRRSDYQDGSRASDSDPITFFTPSKISSSATFVEPFPSLDSEIVRLQDLNPTFDQVLQDLTAKQNLDKHSQLGNDKILRWDDKVTLRDQETFERLRRNFDFPQDKQYVTNYGTTCEPCFRAKARRTKAHGLLQPLPISERPWSFIALDFIVKLRPCETGNDSILVITDRFTKYGLFLPCREEGTTAQVFADLFYRHVFANHGLPSDIVSDRGTVFTSDFWTGLSALTQTKLNLSKLFHPQTDGATERLNQNLEQYLRI